MRRNLIHLGVRLFSQLNVLCSKKAILVSIFLKKRIHMYKFYFWFIRITRDVTYVKIYGNSGLVIFRWLI